MFTKNDTVERLFEVYGPYFNTECMGSGPFGPIFFKFGNGPKKVHFGPKKDQIWSFFCIFWQKKVRWPPQNLFWHNFVSTSVWGPIHPQCVSIYKSKKLIGGIAGDGPDRGPFGGKFCIFGSLELTLAAILDPWGHWVQML